MASASITVDALEFRTALAQSVTGHAASVVVRNAHQVHGAIGTFEHELQELTNPQLVWRAEFGSPRYWDALLTDRMLASGKTAWEFSVTLPHQLPSSWL